MVQILPNNEKPSFSQRLNLGMEALNNLNNQFLQEKKAAQLQQQENLAAEKMGVNLSGFNDPKTRQMLLEQSIKAQNDKTKLQGESVEDLNRYNVIKQHFGEKAANIYKAATEGGKTAFLEHLLENAERGLSFEDEITSAEPNLAKQENTQDQLGDEYFKEDYDKGLTRKEKIQRQDERYKINLPLYQESKSRLQSLDSEKDHLNILQDLSPKVTGLDRLNINPVTGELFIPGLASADAQRYVKTLNDFTTNAKDSYGARVTNFDLQQFMKRLPTLANSEEGRNQILKQMQIINSVNALREHTLQAIIEANGGIRKIDMDEAERLADKKIAPELKKLKAEFKELDSSVNASIKNAEKKLKDIAPKGRVAVRKADGTIGHIEKEKLEAFLKIEGNEAL